MEDNKLLDMFMRRDEQAISLTRAKYETYCTAIALKILQSWEDCEECLNDAMLAVWNSIPPNSPENLKTYLGKITRNLSFSRWRKQSAKRRGGGELTIAMDELSQCVPDRLDLAKRVEDAQLSELINSFLRSCSKRERTIFIRRYWYVESVNDIAKKLSTSPNAIKNSLFRTRNKLKAFLEKEGIAL